MTRRPFVAATGAFPAGLIEITLARTRPNPEPAACRYILQRLAGTSRPFGTVMELNARLRRVL